MKPRKATYPCLGNPDLTEKSTATTSQILKDTKSKCEPDKQPFASLEELYVQYYDEIWGFDLNDIAALFASPSLANIHLYQVQGMANPSSLLTNNSVKSLTFTRSCLDEDGIFHAIRAFPNLESFSFHTGGATVSEGSVHECTPKQLIAALQPVAKNLEHLMLDMAERCHWDDDEDVEAIFPIVSFKDFSALRSLSIEQDNIFTKVEGEGDQVAGQKEDLLDDFFPGTLVNLRLTHVYTDMEKPLQWLAKNIKEQLPVLEELQLDLGREEGGDGHMPIAQHVINPGLFKSVKKSDEASREDEDDSEDAKGSRPYLPVSVLPRSWQLMLRTINAADVSVKVGWVTGYYIKAADKQPFESWMDRWKHEPQIESRTTEGGKPGITIKKPMY
ncbi:hypothetical protein LTR70_004684 [Exophiala xenobiotica]|uniref:Uncharacterized protein n=1 Tax=Lithohypha guttulata TaxID=1690604 RepID=A0ABR0KCJ4_9EURO|nr:hypothetical protein LTR24_004195 [Lithohypha guttulata]KAK5320321.1 hypothetical protein LTR70_004684 [Exophiala xenobiotica]